MVPISSSRTVTAQRPGTEAMISEIHRQSTVGMPTTARATMPPSGDEDPLPERWAYALPARPSSAPAEARADPHTVDRQCREARMSSLNKYRSKSLCRTTRHPLLFSSRDRYQSQPADRIRIVSPCPLPGWAITIHRIDAATQNRKRPLARLIFMTAPSGNVPGAGGRDWVAAGDVAPAVHRLPRHM